MNWLSQQDVTEEGNPVHTNFGSPWVKASRPRDRDPASLSAPHPGAQVQLSSAEDQALKWWEREGGAKTLTSR